MFMYDKYTKWSEDYKEHLENFLKDLNLFQLPNSKIIIALDFYDIFEHCFPFADALRKGETTINNEKIKRIIAREALINSESILKFYSTPLILLPPYLSESLDFIKIYQSNLEDFDLDPIRKDYITSIFETDIGQNISKKDLKNLLDRLEDVSPNFLFLFSPNFNYALENYRKILSNQIVPYLKDLDNYSQFSWELQKQKNLEIEQKVENCRNEKNKKIQNNRDAKAIHYIQEINKRLDENMILILVSSANHMLCMRKDPSLFKTIAGKRYQLIRSTKSFFTGLIEICHLMGSQKKNIRDVLVRDLIDLVGRDLNVLESYIYIVNNPSISGNFGEGVIDEASLSIQRFQKIVEEKERADLLVLVKDLLPNADIGYLKNLDQDLFTIINNVKDLIKSPKFDEILNAKISFLDIEKVLCLMSLSIISQEKDMNQIKNIIKISGNYYETYFESVGTRFARYFREQDYQKLGADLLRIGLINSRNAIISANDIPWYIIDIEKNRIIFFDEAGEHIDLFIMDIRLVKLIIENLGSIFNKFRAILSERDIGNIKKILSKISDRVDPLTHITSTYDINEIKLIQYSISELNIIISSK
jgi:hypothetical protein